KNQMQHLSLSSMGADAADINNDGNLDIFVTDMLPGNDARMKMVSTFEGYDLYKLKKSRDYHNQIMQNTLQLNNGDNTFSEVARFSGVHATDWSWGALLFDMDNDGLKDIFVANGIFKDVTDQDFVNFLVDENNLREFAYGKKFDFMEFQNKIASRPVSNYAFRNEGNMKFVNMASAWGLGDPSFSNGSAYGDIDNDGDLDLVVNNVNQPVGIFRNTSADSLKTHFLSVKLKGYAKNQHGIGTKVHISYGGKQQFLQEMPNRGFESSVDHKLLFGLGSKALIIDSITVIWPDDKMQILTDVKSDQHLTLDHQQASQTWKQVISKASAPFQDITAKTGIDYKHVENDYVDYYKTPLLKQMYSTQGPALATGDVNNDGLDDVVFGGAKGQSPKLYLQDKAGKFTDHTPPAFAADTLADNVDALLFDADNDKDLDLYFVTGSSEFEFNDPALADKFFRNNGKGSFTLEDILPNIEGSGSCVVAGDFDQDGDLDLFVGGRIKPDQLGMNPPSYLYVNDGNSFKNYTKRYFANSEFGMVTGAAWADLDGDNYPELLLVGEWMPITIFKNEKGKGFKKIESKNLKYSEGWWNSIEASDLNGDGKMDFVLGNLGQNSRLRADSLHPVELYVNDFDNNGAIEQILTVYSDDNKDYPMVLKHDLEKQLPFIKKRFIKYADFAGKRIADIFKPEELKDAEIKKAFNGNTSLLINKGSYQFELVSLPPSAQYSPVMSTQTLDYNGDGIMDIILTGNFLDVLPEIGQYDASYGLVLQGKGDFKYEPVTAKESGFFVTGQVRKIRLIKNSKGEMQLILGRNNDKAVIFGVSHVAHP
ncbi:MAG: VCBS repeat-containing protein, partial [Chryseolinea sp.]